MSELTCPRNQMNKYKDSKVKGKHLSTPATRFNVDKKNYSKFFSPPTLNAFLLLLPLPLCVRHYVNENDNWKTFFFSYSCSFNTTTTSHIVLSSYAFTACLWNDCRIELPLFYKVILHDFHFNGFFLTYIRFIF